MTHGDFLEKLERCKFIASMHTGSYASTGKAHDMSPTQAWAAIDYYNRHKDDPKWPQLADETDVSVKRLSKLVDMTSKESLRKSLCEKFQAKSTNGSLNHKAGVGIRPSAVVKLMNVSGLNWFYLNGYPAVHWNEKP